MPGSRYDASIKAKAIRLVRGHAGDYPTQWAAIKAASGWLGMSSETLRKWIRQAEVDEGTAPGVTTRDRLLPSEHQPDLGTLRTSGTLGT